MIYFDRVEVVNMLDGRHGRLLDKDCVPLCLWNLLSAFRGWGSMIQQPSLPSSGYTQPCPT